MSHYRRYKSDGSVYFFTVVTHHRKPLFNDKANVAHLRAAFHHVMDQQSFHIDAMVVLPDYLHCIWRLPEGDHDFSGRWREIKKYTSRRIDRSTTKRGERPVWQRRFWEHQIRDDRDWREHMDYIHYNPVKHGLVERVIDWRWSSFHKTLEQGLYEPNWGELESAAIKPLNFE